MTDDRARMIAALESKFVTGLRDRGFKGSFPHFRRMQPNQIDLVMVQFDKYGGKFAVELGRVARGGFQSGPWKDLPANKIQIPHLSRERLKLMPSRTNHPDGAWFAFGRARTDPPAGEKDQAHYDKVAECALALFRELGEAWLGRPDPPETGVETENAKVRPPLLARLFGFK